MDPKQPGERGVAIAINVATRLIVMNRMSGATSATRTEHDEVTN